jgi:hypothetical protein
MATLPVFQSDLKIELPGDSQEKENNKFINDFNI